MGTGHCLIAVQGLPALRVCNPGGFGAEQKSPSHAGIPLAMWWGSARSEVRDLLQRLGVGLALAPSGLCCGHLRGEVGTGLNLWLTAEIYVFSLKCLCSYTIILYLISNHQVSCFLCLFFQVSKSERRISYDFLGQDSNSNCVFH